MSDNGFQRAVDHIRSVSETEAQKGRLFERLMKAYFREDPLYQEWFSRVWLWKEWVPQFNEEEARRSAENPESGRPHRFDLTDTGIDLVAEERDGGWCAIQCKCYAPGTRIAKGHLDSFVSASARDPFTSRIFVDTGDSWGSNALKTLRGLKPACIVLRFGDLASRPFDWPDLVSRDPEELRYAGEPFNLRSHQREAMDDVLAGFWNHDRGKLIMACGTGKTFTAIRIAEAVAKTGGRVLYLVPSISLFAQSMREWATQKSIPHRYVGICSDTRAGKHHEDASVLELEIPVTTDPARISGALQGPHLRNSSRPVEVPSHLACHESTGPESGPIGYGRPVIKPAAIGTLAIRNRLKVVGGFRRSTALRGNPGYVHRRRRVAPRADNERHLLRATRPRPFAPNVARTKLAESDRTLQLPRSIRSGVSCAVNQSPTHGIPHS